MLSVKNLKSPLGDCLKHVWARPGLSHLQPRSFSVIVCHLERTLIGRCLQAAQCAFVRPWANISTHEERTTVKPFFHLLRWSFFFARLNVATLLLTNLTSTRLSARLTLLLGMCCASLLYLPFLAQQRGSSKLAVTAVVQAVTLVWGKIFIWMKRPLAANFVSLGRSLLRSVRLDSFLNLQLQTHVETWRYFYSPVSQVRVVWF